MQAEKRNMNKHWTSTSHKPFAILLSYYIFSLFIISIVLIKPDLKSLVVNIFSITTLNSYIFFLTLILFFTHLVNRSIWFLLMIIHWFIWSWVKSNRNYGKNKFFNNCWRIYFVWKCQSEIDIFRLIFTFVHCMQWTNVKINLFLKSVCF